MNLEEQGVNKAVGAGIAVVLIAAIAGAVFYVSQNIDGFVKQQIEVIGSDTVGSQVLVDDLKLNLRDGSGKMSGLSIANPEGFSVDKLFRMGSIDIAIDPASLTRDVYVIRAINVDGAAVLAEQVGGGTNLQAMMNQLNKKQAQHTTETTGQEIYLAVDNVNFTNGSVALRSDVFGERTLTIPDFTLTRLGTAEQGLTPDQLGQEIATQLIGQVRDAVEDELRSLAVEAARDKVKEKLDEGLDKLKGLFKKD